MLKLYIHFGTFLLLCFIDSLVLSESNKNIFNSSVSRKLTKRHDTDFQTCLDNFDVHTDKIIRTQDSRDMGAKYINERDVLSRDDCLRLCCETESCDVFVFEEKTPGSCYLFECGTPEDFKCKFTKHKNYTSAVLAINRHLTELESQIKFTQHEHELTNLRQPPDTQEIQKTHPPTTNSPRNQESLNSGIERPPSPPAAPKDDTKCSQYQFKCHTSGECIGIYNACDGIPQCADGSDEALELGCPTSTASPQVTTLSSLKIEAKSDYKTVEEHRKEIQKSSIVSPQQSYGGDTSVLSSGYPQNGGGQSVPLSGPIPNPYYGREGEGMANHHSPDQWNSHIYRQNQGSSQIFNHKGTGIMPQKNDWYYPHPYIPPDLPPQPVMPQYPDQAANYYDNMAYRIPPQNQVLNNWQAPHKTHGGELVGQQQMGEDGSMNRLDRIPVGNPPSPEDYYEEVYRNRQQPYPQHLPLSPHHPGDTKMMESPMEMSNEERGMKHDVPKKKPPTEAPEATTTPRAKEVTPGHVSHRKVEKMSVDLKVKESSLDEEIDGHNTSPSGAVLSLTMGVVITLIMVVFVGCRMKVVRRRMRRGGKSPYAHDADFLVNGMYL